MRIFEGKEIIDKDTDEKYVIESVENKKITLGKKGSNLTFEIPRKYFNSIFS